MKTRWALGRADRIGAVLLLAMLAACKEAPPPAPPPPEVLVHAVEQRDVPVHQEWIGTITGFINATIRPQVKGYVLTKNYKEGDVVEPGDLLFQIDPREFRAALDQALGDLAQAEAALGKTQLDVARYGPLAKQGAVSQQELDNAVQANQANKAAVDAARAAVEQARLNLEWTKVTSPIKGVAGIAVAQIGNLVDAATELTTVSQLDPIKVVFPVSEQGYLRYARAQASDQPGSATQKGALELILADGTVFPQRGTVSVIGREVDPRTGTLTVEGLFDNPGNILRPGGYAKVRAVVDNLPNAIVVPQAAVQDLQGTMQVAVVNPQNTVEIRNVTTGPRIDGDWVIRNGLQPGERVIVEGLQKVRSGMTVSPKPYIGPTAVPKATPAPF
ncbi:MAG: efflux RND transporter periplasmic adaptor subunit [Candidatus Binatia bacterium]